MTAAFIRPARRAATFLLLTGASSLSLGIGSSAAQDTAPAPAADESEAITVTGSYGYQPVDVKRRQNVIVDSVLNDDIEAPTGDNSIAQMVMQVPGVGYIADGDEPRYVTLRGLSPDLNVTTIEGLNIATIGESGTGARRVNMQQLPSDLAGRVDVYKTMTAEQDAAGIGGAVDIVTRSAFTTKTPYLMVDAYGIYSTFKGPGGENSGGSKRHHWGEGLKAVFSTRFGSESQFGLTVSGRFQERVRNSSKNWHDGQTYFNTAGASIGNTPDPARDWDGKRAITKFSYGDYSNTITNKGASAKLEWQPSPNVYAFVMGYWYNRKEESTMNEQEFIGAANRITDREEYTGTTGVNYLQYTLRGPDQWERVSSGAIAGTDWSLGDRSRLSVRGGYTKETFNEFEPYGRVRTVGNQSDEFFTYDLSGKQPQMTGYIGDPFANKWYVTRASFTTTDTYEDVADIRADYAFNLDAGSRGFGFKAGAEWRRLRLDKNIDADYRIVGTGVDATSYMYDPQYRMYPDAAANPWLNHGKFWNELVPTLPNDPVQSASSSRLSDFFYKEDVINAYLSAHYVTDHTHIIAGLRYDDASYNGHGAKTENGVLSQTEWAYQKGRYKSWLPSLNVTQNLGDNIKVRAGISRTIGRPNPADIVKAETYVCDDAGESGCVISRGNPDLKPRRSTNYDLAFEGYFGNSGLVALSLFAKEIKDDIFTLRTEVPGEDGLTTVITQPMNAETSKIKGVELALVQRSFGFHPNLGASFNLTWMKGKMNYRTNNTGGVRTVDGLVSQPKWLANLAVSYDIPIIRATARLSANYQSDNLDAVGVDNWADKYKRAQTSIDFSFWHELNDHLTLKYEFDNITNSRPEWFHTRNLGTNSQRDNYGRSIYVHAIYKM